MRTIEVGRNNAQPLAVLGERVGLVVVSRESPPRGEAPVSVGRPITVGVFSLRKLSHLGDPDAVGGQRIDPAAVVKPGGEQLPIDLALELVEGRGDLGRITPGEPVVLAALVKGALVFEAEEHVHGAIPVRDEDGIVVGDRIRIGVF